MFLSFFMLSWFSFVFFFAFLMFLSLLVVIPFKLYILQLCSLESGTYVELVYFIISRHSTLVTSFAFGFPYFLFGCLSASASKPLRIAFMFLKMIFFGIKFSL